MNEPLDSSASSVDLQHRFRRMPPAVLDAMLAYQRTSEPALVPIIVTGILTHYLPPEAAASFTAPREQSNDHRNEVGQANALGVDSLTMVEIVLDLEDALGIEFDKQELISVHAASEMHALLLHKIRAKSHPTSLSP